MDSSSVLFESMTSQNPCEKAHQILAYINIQDGEQPWLNKQRVHITL